VPVDQEELAGVSRNLPRSGSSGSPGPAAGRRRSGLGAYDPRLLLPEIVVIAVHAVIPVLLLEPGLQLQRRSMGFDDRRGPAFPKLFGVAEHDERVPGFQIVAKSCAVRHFAALEIVRTVPHAPVKSQKK